MEEILERVANVHHLDGGQRKMLATLADLLRKGAITGPLLLAAASDFLRKWSELGRKRCQFWRPEREPAVVGLWKAYWKLVIDSCPDRTVAEEAEKSTLAVLHLVCRCRSLVTSIYQAEVTAQVPIAPPPTAPAPPTPKCLVNRYDTQVAYVMIRAKKWMKRNGSVYTTAAKRILEKLAPNTSHEEATSRPQFYRQRWRYSVRPPAVELVRSIDLRAIALFDGDKFGPASLKAVLMLLRRDRWLLSQLTKVVEGVTAEPASPDVIEYLLKAIVDGSALSIGGHLIRIANVKAKPAVVAPSLREGEKVKSAAKKGKGVIC